MVNRKKFFQEGNTGIMSEKDTVAAISTPYGRGGVALIRVSGPEAVVILSRVFVPKSGISMEKIEPGRLVYGQVRHGSEVVDDGMAVVFRAPRSFTGEDTAEITCHGGILVTERVLGAVFAAGAVPAGPGEFTKRAFLNGKLALSQAEAIADIIDAHSVEMLWLSGANSRGALKREIDRIERTLTEIVAAAYVDTDFPDEDLSGMDVPEMTARLKEVCADLDKLIASYRTGKAVSEGINTVLAGKPNTGKSSLLNLICGEERAIVTDVAGTTRDVLEEKVVIGRVTLNLCDTAGIRTARSKVEQIGVEKAETRLDGADLILAVFDSSIPLDRYDAHFIDRMRSVNAAKIAVINKSDLPKQMDPYQIEGLFDRIVFVSAATGEGKQELFDTIEGLYTEGKIDYDTTAIVANARQHAALEQAREAVAGALDALRRGCTADVAALELELALARLCETDGRRVSETVVTEIFHRFCVGK